ncbi:MAG: acetate--CoA ligase [Chloroflexi bacterium]|nr:acetate--CoA ligase [Chloroflexota bacterium]MCY3937761.1 acetate--CoA ligase [Chloroflexota bacterium]
MAETEGDQVQVSTFEPPDDFARDAHVGSFEQYEELHRRSLEEPESFWREITDQFVWTKPWTKLREWNLPFTRWFVDGELNITVNCLDRHVENGLGDKIAIRWEGEPGDTRTVSFRELLDDTCRFANGLKSLGLQSGDRVVIYMPMIPELPVAMLACARLGLVHSVIFGGFSSDAIRDRVQDASARAIITADGGWRRGKVIPLKDNVDGALTDDECPSVERVVVYERCKNEIEMADGRDIWWNDLIEGQPADCEPESVPAEHPLYILYTSGTTGKPKGVVHAQGGYLIQTALTSKWIFDLKPDDIYWCTADIGWVTGHSYIVYGILANATTGVMYEGAPDYPAPDRFWEIVDKYNVTVFYTAPTAIRAFIKWGDEWPEKHDLSSLRLLGTVGEPINPDVWLWYRRVIGGGSCPIVDTWWQTETGGILITPIPGAITTKPGSATLPFPGVDADVVDESGNPVAPNERGLLVIKRPWPSMIRGIYKDGWGQPGHEGEFGDRDRFFDQYFKRIEGVYLAGDAARRDNDGYFWIIGRVDDVLNVAGHRIGTAEVESCLVQHPAVAEAAVIGFPDEITGEAVAAFVTLRGSFEESSELQAELVNFVGERIGRFVRPKLLRFTPALPKTRSGKIMRRLLREIATSGKVVGDTTTLEDMAAVAALQGIDEEE